MLSYVNFNSHVVEALLERSHVFWPNYRLVADNDGMYRSKAIAVNECSEGERREMRLGLGQLGENLNEYIIGYKIPQQAEEEDGRNKLQGVRVLCNAASTRNMWRRSWAGRWDEMRRPSVALETRLARWSSGCISRKRGPSISMAAMSVINLRKSILGHFWNCIVQRLTLCWTSATRQWCKCKQVDKWLWRIWTDCTRCAAKRPVGGVPWPVWLNS